MAGEFWAEFFRVKHRRIHKDMQEWDRRLVAHAVEILSLEKGARLLDLGCGKEKCLKLHACPQSQEL